MDRQSTSRLRLVLIVLIAVLILILFVFLLTKSDISLLSTGILLGILVLVAVMFGLNYYAMNKRREAIQIFGQEHGFQFAPEDTALETGLTSDSKFSLFSRGRMRYVRSILSGRRSGADCKIFDYQYTTGSGKSSHTHRQTVILLTLTNVDLVPFQIQPEGIFEKLAAKFGQADIDFPDRPEFSNKYRLTGDDETAVRGVFNDALLSYFEGQENICAEARGAQLVIYTRDRQIAPEDLLVRLDKAVQLSSLLYRTGPNFY